MFRTEFGLAAALFSPLAYDTNPATAELPIKNNAIPESVTPKQEAKTNLKKSFILVF